GAFGAAPAPESRTGPSLDGGSGSLPAKGLPPATSVELHTSFFIAICCVTHGPPARLQPAQLKIDISRFNCFASSAEWRTAWYHSSVPKLIFGSTTWPLPDATSTNWKPPIPTRFIHSRSFVMP